MLEDKISQQVSLNLTVARAQSFYSDSEHVTSLMQMTESHPHIPNIYIWVEGIWQGVIGLL